MQALRGSTQGGKDRCGHHRRFERRHGSPEWAAISAPTVSMLVMVFDSETARRPDGGRAVAWAAAPRVVWGSASALAARCRRGLRGQSHARVRAADVGAARFLQVALSRDTRAGIDR